MKLPTRENLHASAMNYGPESPLPAFMRLLIFETVVMIFLFETAILTREEAIELYVVFYGTTLTLLLILLGTSGLCKAYRMTRTDGVRA